jgi:hypothetical protein
MTSLIRIEEKDLSKNDLWNIGIINYYMHNKEYLYIVNIYYLNILIL